jgi:hypothetical protein
MDRVKGPESAVWLAHRATLDLIVDRDVGEGCQQVPGLWQQSGHGTADGPGEFDAKQCGTARTGAYRGGRVK